MEPEQVTTEEEAQQETGVAEAESTPEDGTPAWEERVQALEQQAEEARAEARTNAEHAAALQSQLTETLERYRGLLLAGDPDVPPELVEGGAVAELDASYGRAAELVGRLRRQAAERAAEERVPPGAPARRGTDPASLTTEQKILMGLRQSQ